MTLHTTRRSLFATPLLLAAEPAPPVSFPAQPADLVREMVTVAHGNVTRVRELLAQRPALANAAIDWGFGDWETALGAASHVGNRAIAEMLLERGAPPTLFSAAMLGDLETVKAMVSARPGVQRTLGPHSISLLAHARAGGAQARGVAEYLEALGGAAGLPAASVSEDEIAPLAGEYVYGNGATEKIRITQKGKQLAFTREGMPSRNLFPKGGDVFRPAGAHEVEVRFDRSASTLLIRDGDLTLVARKPGAPSNSPQRP